MEKIKAKYLGIDVSGLPDEVKAVVKKDRIEDKDAIYLVLARCIDDIENDIQLAYPTFIRKIITSPKDGKLMTVSGLREAKDKLLLIE